MVDLKKITMTALLFTLAMLLVNTVIIFLRADALRVVIGLQSEVDHLTETLQGHYLAMEQIESLPNESQVLMLWEPRTFYCLPRCSGDDHLNMWWHALQLENDTTRIVLNWLEQGYTHVLVFDSGARFIVEEEGFGDLLTEEHLAKFEDLQNTSLQQVWQIPETYTLYQIKSGN